MEARLESLGTQSHKNPQTRTLEEKNTSRDRKKMGPWTPWGVRERTFFKKSHNHPRNRPYRPPALNDRLGLKNDCPGLKNDRSGVKNDRKFNDFADKKQDS